MTLHELIKFIEEEIREYDISIISINRDDFDEDVYSIILSGSFTYNNLIELWFHKNKETKLFDIEDMGEGLSTLDTRTFWIQFMARIHESHTTKA